MFRVDFVDSLGQSRPTNQLLELILLILGPVEAKKIFGPSTPPKNQLFELILSIFGLGPPKKSTF